VSVSRASESSVTYRAQLHRGTKGSWATEALLSLFLPPTPYTCHLEFDIKAIDFDADVYDGRKALEPFLHGPDLYDPNNPRNKGRNPNFEVVLDQSRLSHAGRIHWATTALAFSVSRTSGTTCTDGLGTQTRTRSLSRDMASVFSVPPASLVSPLVKQQLENLKALYVGPEKGNQRKTIESQASQVRPRIAKGQFGVWYRRPNSPPNHGRAFSIEYEPSSPKAKHTSL
jgi:RNA-dependent RNA polymerase